MSIRFHTFAFYKHPFSLSLPAAHSAHHRRWASGFKLSLSITPMLFSLLVAHIAHPRKWASNFTLSLSTTKKWFHFLYWRITPPTPEDEHPAWHFHFLMGCSQPPPQKISVGFHTFIFSKTHLHFIHGLLTRFHISTFTFANHNLLVWKWHHYLLSGAVSLLWKWACLSGLSGSLAQISIYKKI